MSFRMECHGSLDDSDMCWDCCGGNDNRFGASLFRDRIGNSLFIGGTFTKKYGDIRTFRVVVNRKRGLFGFWLTMRILSMR